MDSGNSKAHVNRANLSFYVERAWAQSEAEYLSSIKSNQSDASAYSSYSLFLASRNRSEEAIETISHALRLNPLSARTNVSAGWVFRYAEQYEVAMSHVDRAMDLDPEFYGAHLLKGVIEQVQERFEPAVDAYRKALELRGGQVVISILATSYMLMNRRDEANGLLTLLMGLGKYQYISPFNIARVYSALGDDDHAYEWLEKACKGGSSELVFFDRERDLGNANILGTSFNNDPRVTDLLHRSGSL